ncbi:MAG: hypothetical protein LBK06_09460, partial [Planctomycetaceae bacterium]|nr:hypothetical protein [Planctomycetaceae bacterium]
MECKVNCENSGDRPVRTDYEEVVNHFHDEDLSEVFRAVEVLDGLETERGRHSDDEDEIFVRIATSRFDTVEIDSENDDDDEFEDDNITANGNNLPNNTKIPYTILTAELPDKSSVKEVDGDNS